MKRSSICKSYKRTATALLLAACLLSAQSYAQKNKSILQQAESYFAAGEYYTAANLYGQYLHPANDTRNGGDFPLNAKRNPVAPVWKDRLLTLYRQAESFRMANHWQEAIDAYQQCVVEDPATYADGFYWIAVGERSLGHYGEAAQWLAAYESSGSARFAAAMKQERTTLSFLRQQQLRPDSILFHTQKINAAESAERGLFSAQLLSGNQVLISSTVSLHPQDPNENPNRSRLFVAVLENDRVTNIQPVPVPLDSAYNWGAGTFSADGRYLYLTRWTSSGGKTKSDIFYCQKINNEWMPPQPLQALQNNNCSNKQPFCSADGQWLLFSSDRKGGIGGFDIWYARLEADGSCKAPVNAGSQINTSGNEQAPFYHSSSNTLVFSSDARTGMGGYDLFMSNGHIGGNWNEVMNPGKPVNSSRDDIYFTTAENHALFENALVGSDRGEGCCLETYRIQKAAKKQLLQGVVQDCRTGVGLADVAVTMEDQEGRHFTAVTNEKGEYLFNTGGVPMNDYRLSASRDGYKDSSYSLSINDIKNEWLSDLSLAAPLCQEKKLILKVENVVTVYFGYDKSDLSASANEKLDSIISILGAEPTSRVQISGYTDGKGSAEYNRQLSDRRAKSCAAYLMEHGISADRISFESFGSCCPVEMEMINGRDNPDGRSRNRRALINIDRN